MGYLLTKINHFMTFSYQEACQSLAHRSYSYTPSPPPQAVGARCAINLPHGVCPGFLPTLPGRFISTNRAVFSIFDDSKHVCSYPASLVILIRPVHDTGYETLISPSSFRRGSSVCPGQPLKSVCLSDGVHSVFIPRCVADQCPPFSLL